MSEGWYFQSADFDGNKATFRQVPDSGIFECEMCGWRSVDHPAGTHPGEAHFACDLHACMAHINRAPAEYLLSMK